MQFSSSIPRFLTQNSPEEIHNKARYKYDLIRFCVKLNNYPNSQQPANYLTNKQAGIEIRIVQFRTDFEMPLMTLEEVKVQVPEMLADV